MITMTHCSCTFCESCFKAYFSSVIKEKSIEHAVCPLCNEPDVRAAGRREESMEYFNLLDTQVRLTPRHATSASSIIAQTIIHCSSRASDKRSTVIFIMEQ